MKIIYLLILTLSLFFISCQTQKQLEYKKAITSYELADIQSYIKKYPEDENIAQLEFRVRVIEYERIKKSNNIMLLNYFVKKYKNGKDVNKIKDVIFSMKLKNKKNDIEYLTYLKTIFNEDKYIKIINEKIYKINEIELSNINTIKNDEQEDRISEFLEKHPTNKFHLKLRKELKVYQLKKIIKSKNLNKINYFIQKYPEYYNDKIKAEMANILLSQYQNAPLNILKRFLENNKDYKNYSELEKTYINRAYKKYISFYKYNQLIELDNKYHNKDYQKDILWFKNNKEQVLKINKLISSLFKAIPYKIEEEDDLYQIARNTKEESEFIIKSAFFTNNINNIIKKVSSHFFIIQLSAFKALEYYYNQDVISRRRELIKKYKSLEKFKNKYYKEKILLIALVLNDENLFLRYLDKLSQNKTLWINFLRYNFLDTSSNNFINLIYDIASIDFKVIYSDKTLEKNKFDRKINLSLTRTLLNHVINEMQKKGILSSKSINRKINTLKHYFKDIEFFKFSLVNYYESKTLKDIKKLIKTIKINDYLKDSIINKSPIVKVKKLLIKNNCSSWCNKKENIYKMFFKNMD